MSEDRCGVPRLISRLPILWGGPLLLDRRWLEDGLDTLAGGDVAGGWTSGCSEDRAVGRRPLMRAAVVAPTTVVDLGVFGVENLRPLNRPGEAEGDAVAVPGAVVVVKPGSEGARLIRGWWWW